MRGGQQARLLGRWGEAQAARYLRRRGWEILASGFRCRMGELDLVASDGVYLVFVEVKLRRDDRFAPAAAAVDRGKQRRLKAAAEYYLLCHPTDLQPRFDVVEVYAPQGTATRQPTIPHIPNAF